MEKYFQNEKLIKENHKTVLYEIPLNRTKKKNSKDRINYKDINNKVLTYKKYFEINFKNESINNKKLTLKPNICIILLLKLLILFISIPFSQNDIRKLYSVNEISYSIIGDGITYQLIFSPNVALPDEIIINGENKENKLTFYLLENCTNTIVLRWNKTLQSIAFLFYDIKQVYTVDFSNFDTAGVTDMSSMFYGCVNLKSIKFGNLNTSLVESMNDMFYGSSSLKSLDLRMFNTSSVKAMRNMFKNCTSLESIDLSSFDTTKVQNMEGMFENDKSLISLDLSNFNISDTKVLNNFLSGCKSLVFINLNSLVEYENVVILNMITSDLKDIIFCIDDQQSNKIFSAFQEYSQNNDCDNICFSETKKIILGKKMCIDDCSKDTTYKYEYNNICYDHEISENVETENLESSENEESEETINKEETDSSKTNENTEITEKEETENLKTNENTQITEKEETENSKTNENIEITEKEETENSKTNENTQITEIEKSLDITENSEQIEIAERIESKIEESEIITENIEETEKVENTEKIEKTEVEETENSKTIENTEKEETSENDEKTEIVNTQDSTQNIKNNTETQNPIEKNHESTEITINTDELNNKNIELLEDFSAEEFFKDSSTLNSEIPFVKDKLIESIKEQLMNGSLNILLLNVTDGEKKDLIAQDKNTIYQITTTENQNNNEYNNISTVNLGDCEDRLKGIYGIDKNLSLIIFKIDYYKEGLLIPVIGYEIYNPINKSLLNLSYCEDILIKLNIPVSINENNVFKHDPNSEYYTDECFAYTTEKGTDILLDDRKSEYVDNNYSLCESNCNFSGYNEDTKKAICECETKKKIGLISDIINNENVLSNDFSGDNSASNVITMKCAHTLFTKEGLITNIGNYLLVFTFLFFLVSAIIFYKCGYTIIQNNITDILEFKKKKTKNIDIFSKTNKIKKYKHKKLTKKNFVSNPKKRKSKTFKIEKQIKNNHHNSSSKLEFKNTNIIFNIGKPKKQKTLKPKRKSYKAMDVKNEKSFSILKNNEFELNSLNYNDALYYDKRTFCQYYLSVLKYNNMILFSFYPVEDYNLKIIKISLFFLSFIIYFFINSLFFNNSSIHQIYEDDGAYNFSYFISKIFYSFLISYYIIVIIKYIFLSQKNLLELKNEEKLTKIDEKVVKTRRCLVIKYITFYILSFVFLSFFWYYLSSFCAVYKNSQFYVIENTFISFFISLLYPILFNLLTCIIRLFSLRKEEQMNKCIYKISQFLQKL